MQKNNSPHHNNNSGYLISIGAAVCWALTGPGVAFIQSNFALQAAALAFWRVAITSVVLLVGLGVFRPALLRINRQQCKWLALSGIIGIGIYQTVFVTSIRLNGAAIGIVLVYLYPVFVALGSRIFLKETLTLNQIVAMFISVIGCALIVQLYNPALLLKHPLGAVLGIGSAILQAAYTLLNRRISVHTPTHPITMLVYTFVFGGCTMLLYVLVGARAATFETMDWTALPTIAALALGPTMTGYAMFNWALSKLSGRIVSLIVIAEVPLAAIIGVVFLKETLNLWQALGIGLVLFGIIFPSLGIRSNPQPSDQGRNRDNQPV